MTAAGSNPTAQYRVLATRVDAVQIPGIIAQIQDWIARRDSCRYVGAPAEKYTATPVWFGPRDPNDRVVIRQEMWCRPCFDYRIFDQPYRLRAIEPQDVLDAATHLLSDIHRAVEQESV
jgi:hypothetical protein